MATVVKVDSEGHLELREDPEAWINNNPASRVALVTTLELFWYDKEEIGESIGELTHLIRLEFNSCGSLKRVPNTITRLHKLEHLLFHDCYRLEELPANIGNLVSLTHLQLSFCKNIKFLPNSIVNLSKLTSLTLSDCDSLVELPANIVQLASLTHLELRSCMNIKSLPMSVANLPKLTSLSLSSLSLSILPCNLGLLKKSLTSLDLSYCNNIEFLPNIISNLSNLTSLSLSYCESLVELPADIGQLVRLTQLKLHSCDNIKSLPMSIANLSNLTSLSLIYCDSLTELPSNLGQMKSLSHLQLYYCFKIKSLPNSMKHLCSLDTLIINYCNSLTQLPIDLNVLHLNLTDCCHHLLRTGISLIKLKYLEVDACSCSDEYFVNWKNPYSLQHLTISGCFRHRSYIIKVPASLIQFVNLQVLSVQKTKNKVLFVHNFFHDLCFDNDIRFVELPANLDGFAHLCLLDIQDSSISCLPWSITKLRKLQHLMLRQDFRLETLPYELNNSVIISVEERHVRKSWEELKTEIGQLSIPFGGDIGNDAAQNPSILSHPGYLRLERDPSQWLINNRNSLMLVRFLELNRVEELTESIMQFSDLTHLYLDNINVFGTPFKDFCLPDYFVTLTRLAHLSLDFDVVKTIHSLSKLSNLQTLHLCLRSSELFANFNMPVSLKHLSLSYCNDMRPLYDSLEKLTNLKTLDLYSCVYCESLPPSMYLDKLRLIDCSFESLDSLPIGLHHLEILIFKDYNDLGYIFEKCWNQVNLETLSITCSKMEFLTEYIARLSNLLKLQLKDCVSLKKLPSNLHQLVNLHTLDISVTGIKTLPLSFVKQCKLQHLILPKCFNMQSLPEKLKKVSIIDDTEEAYYKRKGYDASLNQASADTSDESKEEETELGVVPGVYHSWLKYDCSMQSPPKGLMKAEHLKIALCKCSKELLANLKESMHLLHLAIKDCSQHHVKKFATNFNVLANLKTLSIRCIQIESLPSFAGLCSLLKLYIGGVEKLPADLDKLDKLLAVDIHDTKIKCLPWSIKKLKKLRFLNLPLDFKLETLPCQLIESVIITLDGMHIRKTWKELKTEMELLSFRGVVVDETQKISTISSSGYLQLKDNPGLWIRKNKDLCLLVRSLELELPVAMQEIGDSIMKLRKLTYLYISGNIYLDLKHLSGVSKTLTHLSLQHCNIEFQSDSLGKLSNLEFLCLDLGDTNLPSDLDLLVKLRHLSLRHGSKHSNIDSMARLSNLKALDLFLCDFESLPANLKLAELKLSGSNIRSLPTSLYRLEILHDKGTCKRTECNVTSLNLKQLINLEKLSVTCYSMELIPSIERLQNLQALQLKDCSSLEALPNYLGELVKLCTLDISGTRIKSLPDSITMLSNLKNLILPKCFQEDNSVKYPNKGFINVTIDDIVELYFNYMSDDDDDETSMEISCDEQPLPHNLPAIQVRGDPCYNKGETSNPSGESSHAMQNTITTESEQGIAPACATKIYDCGEINHRALESEQNHIPQCNNVKIKMKRKDITLEMLQPFWSNHTTLVDAAEELGVKRSTLKRRIKELNVIWPRKGKKQQLDAKKRKLNYKAPFGSDCSQQNLVNLGNSAADHAENVEEHIMGSDLHTLPNHVSSNSNVVINLTPDATMETIRGNLMETIGSHQGAEVHLDGANERPLSDTLPQNEKSNNFIVKAGYNDDIVRFDFSLSKSIDQLKEEVANQLELEVNSFKIKYQDEDKDWVLVTRISNLEHALNLSRSSNDSSVVRLLIVPKT